MKKIVIIGLVSCGLFATACQESMQEEPLRQEGIYTLVGEIGEKAADSRAQIQLGRNEPGGERVFWNRGDQFTLYQDEGGTIKTTLFSISTSYREPEEGEVTNAVFNSEVPANTGKYIAVYPANLPWNDDKLGVIQFSLQHDLDFTNAHSPAEIEAVWKDYLKNNMYLMAKGDLKDGDLNSIHFEHLCTMIRVSVSNETSEEMPLESIGFSGGPHYTTSMSYIVNPSRDHANGYGATTWYRVNTKNLKVAPGETTDLYIVFFPSGFRDSEAISIDFQNYNTLYLPVADIIANNTGATGFEAGKRYWLKMKYTPNGVFWSKDYGEFEGETLTLENPSFSTLLLQLFGNRYVRLNEEGNAVMPLSFVEELKELRFDGMGGVETLDGIEMFGNLEVLSARNVGLKAVDVSKNLALRYLDLTNNPDITELDLSKNIALDDLQLTNMPIDSIDLSNNVNLETGLLLVGMPIKELDLSKNVKLKQLNCRSCQISELDITPLTHLEKLYCGGQQNGITINVYMTEKQKALWDAEWCTRWENPNVNVIVK